MCRRSDICSSSKAIFQTLCQLRFTRHPTLPGPGLILTVPLNQASLVCVLRADKRRERATLTLRPVKWSRHSRTIYWSSSSCLDVSHHPLTCSSVPIVALVDSDAYGLDILSVYKYGSQGLRHENGKLAAHRIEWLGIRASELSECANH